MKIPRFALVTALAALTASSIFGQSGFYLSAWEDPLMSWVEAANLIEGILPLSVDAPMVSSRLLSAFPEAKTITKPAVERLRMAAFSREKLQALDSDASLFGGIGAILIPEFYVGLPGSSVPNYFGYLDRSAFLAIPGDLSIGDLFAFGGTVDFPQNPDAVLKPLVPENHFNIPSNFGYLDFRFPLRSYALARGPFWTIRIGRDELFWGPGADSLILSRNAGFFDHVYAEFHLQDFEYSFFAASLDSRQEGFRGSPVGGAFNDMPRTLLLHRLQARFLDRIRIGLVEGTLIGGIIPEIADFNPFRYYHNTFVWDHSSSYDGAEFEILPWKYASLYGQVVANQVQSSWEVSEYGADHIPSAFAWQLGSKAYIPAGEGIISARVEFNYANPWMYIREYPEISYSNEHYLGSNVPGTSQYDFPCIGFTYGPDAIALSARAGYAAAGSWDADLSLEYVLKGEQRLDSPYVTGDASVGLVTPTGIPEKTLVIAGRGSWSPFTFLTLRFAGAWINRENPGHLAGARDWDIQAMASVSLDCVAAGAALRNSVSSRRTGPASR